MQVNAKKHGCEKPWAKEQIVLYASIFLLLVTFYGVCAPCLGDYNQGGITAVYSVLSACGIAALLRLQTTDPSAEYPPLDEPDRSSDKVRVTHQYCALCSEQRGVATYYSSWKRKHCRWCNKCVPQFDHHCAYLNTCINRANRCMFLTTLAAMLSISMLQVNK